jgi:hypothetical protein
VQVAHACYPRYSGGRDQEDLGLKPAQVNSSRPHLLKKQNKNPTTKKRAGEVAQGIGPQFRSNTNTGKKEVTSLSCLYVFLLKVHKTSITKFTHITLYLDWNLRY